MLASDRPARSAAANRLGFDSDANWMRLGSDPHAQQRRTGRQGRAGRGAGLGDDAQGALRADEELLEVVAGVVLAEGGEGVEDAAVGEHRLQAQHRAVQAAVAQQAQAARVGGHVAAQLAAALGAEVERHGEAARGEVGVELLEDAAWRRRGGGGRARWRREGRCAALSGDQSVQYAV